MSVSGLTGLWAFISYPRCWVDCFPFTFQQEGHVQSSLANNFVYPQKEKYVHLLSLQKWAETGKKIRGQVEYLFIKNTYSWRIYTYSSRSSSFFSRVFSTSVELGSHSETRVKEETSKTKAKEMISYLGMTYPTNISFFFRLSRKFFPLTWMVGNWKGDVGHVCEFFKDNNGKNLNI